MNESSVRHIRLTPSFVRCAKRLVKRNPSLGGELRETIDGFTAETIVLLAVGSHDAVY